MKVSSLSTVGMLKKKQKKNRKTGKHCRVCFSFTFSLPHTRSSPVFRMICWKFCFDMWCTWGSKTSKTRISVGIWVNKIRFCISGRLYTVRKKLGNGFRRRQSCGERTSERLVSGRKRAKNISRKIGTDFFFLGGGIFPPSNR